MRISALLLATASLVALGTGAAVAQTAPTPAPQNEPAAQPTEVQEVVITAAPFGVAEDALTVNTETIRRRELDVSPPQTLGDLVSGLPGVRSTFFGPGAGRPVIRGLAGPRVQVLTNGIQSIDVSAVSPDHAVAADPQEAQRIEVLRGPSTILYGGSAIGGVVNVIDNRVATVAPAGGFGGRANFQGSSVDDGIGGSVSVVAGEGPLVFTLDASGRRAEDYRIPGPQISQRLADALGVEREGANRVLNSAVEEHQLGAGASYIFDRGFIGLAVRRQESEYGTVAEPDVTSGLEQTRVDLRGEYRFNDGFFESVRLTSAYGDYEHTEFEGADVGTRFVAEGTEARLELIQRQRGDLSGVVGVQGVSRTFEAIGEEAFVPPVEIGELGLFTLQRIDRGSYGFEGGLRVDRRELQSPFASRDFTSVSATGGVFFRPRDNVYLGLSVARNERAPNEVELFADGPHVATGTFEIGDSDFDTERAISLEGAAHYSDGPFAIDLHLFYVRYDGFIDARPTGEFAEGEEEGEEGLPIFQYAQTDARFYGAELEASYRLFRDGARQLRLEGQYDFVRGDTDLGAPARIPSYSLTGRLVHESPSWAGRLEVRHVGEQDRVADFELPTDAFTLVNLYGGYTLADTGVTLFAEVRNLGDEEAREHTSFLKDIAPLPGRNFRAGVSVRF